jgi:hypothetical protein
MDECAASTDRQASSYNLQLCKRKSFHSERALECNHRLNGASRHDALLP